MNITEPTPRRNLRRGFSDRVMKAVTATATPTKHRWHWPLALRGTVTAALALAITVGGATAAVTSGSALMQRLSQTNLGKPDTQNYSLNIDNCDKLFKDRQTAIGTIKIRAKNREPITDTTLAASFKQNCEFKMSGVLLTTRIVNQLDPVVDGQAPDLTFGCTSPTTTTAWQIAPGRYNTSADTATATFNDGQRLNVASSTPLLTDQGREPLSKLNNNSYVNILVHYDAAAGTREVAGLVQLSQPTKDYPNYCR